MVFRVVTMLKELTCLHVFCYSIVLIVMSSLFVCILHPLAKAAIREGPCINFLFFCLYFSMKNLHPLAKAVIRERPCNHCYTITNTIVCLPHKLPLLHCFMIFSFFGVFSFLQKTAFSHWSRAGLP